MERVRAHRLRTGDRFEYHEGERGVFVVARVTDCSAQVRREGIETREAVFHNDVKYRTVNGVKHKIVTPLETPKVVEVKVQPKYDSISPYASVRILESVK